LNLKVESLKIAGYQNRRTEIHTLCRMQLLVQLPIQVLGAQMDYFTGVIRYNQVKVALLLGLNKPLAS
jgi:hypothetical protein